MARPLARAESVHRTALASLATRRVIERQLGFPRASLTLVTLSLGYVVRAALFAALVFELALRSLTT